MKLHIKTLLPALALITAATGPILAQPAPSPEQARLLEQQVRAWLTTMTAGAVPIPDGLVQFKPDSSGYVITAPIGTLLNVEPKDAALTAHAHMLDATRWAIDSEQFPPTLKITTQQRFPNAPDPAAPPGARPSGTHLETVTYDVKFGQQTVTGVFDPTYATPSNSEGTLTSLDMVQTGGPMAAITHIGQGTTISSSTPTGDKRTDLLVDSTLHNYDIKVAAPGGGPTLTLTMEKVHVVSALTGFAHEKLAPLIALAVTAAKATQASQAPTPTPTPAVKPGAKPAPRPAAKPSPAIAADEARTTARLRALLVAANGLLTGAKLEETADGVAFAFDGHDGTLAHLGITFAGDAPQDMLSASMGLTMDGLTVAELPPALAGYIPTHFAIHPTVSNLSTVALTKMAMDATAPDGTGRATDADFATLFQHGGIDFGFDTFALDIAGTKFTGTGSFKLAGPQTVNGQAEISATGLDALITKAQADPMLAQGVPVIIFLKGIAKTNADQSVWQVSIANGKTLVNGVDLSAMTGGMK